MNRPSRLVQRGFGLVHIIVLGLLLGAGGLAAVKIGKPYADAKIMQKIVDRTLTAAKDEPALSPNDITKRIYDQAGVQSLLLEPDSVEVKLVGAGIYSVKIDMSTKIPLWKNAFLLLELGAQGQTN